jgi:predicted anti-sigma-YlaC factor YlaD
MDCTSYREAISARLDGEATGLPPAVVDAHLATCPGCRAWADAALRVTRAARVVPADPVPDLTVAIMSSLRAQADKAAPRRPTEMASPVSVARFGLFMVAVLQLCTAVPALLGDDAGAPVHIAHEQGSWALALAVGLLVVVWRPSRASAMLPLVAALVVGLGLTMALDIAAGRTQAAVEAPHGLAFLGLGLLWLMAHPGFGLRRDPPRDPHLAHRA